MVCPCLSHTGLSVADCEHGSSPGIMYNYHGICCSVEIAGMPPCGESVHVRMGVQTENKLTFLVYEFLALPALSSSLN